MPLFADESFDTRWNGKACNDTLSRCILQTVYVCVILFVPCRTLVGSLVSMQPFDRVAPMVVVMESTTEEKANARRLARNEAARKRRSRKRLEQQAAARELDEMYRAAKRYTEPDDDPSPFHANGRPKDKFYRYGRETDVDYAERIPWENSGSNPQRRRLSDSETGASSEECDGWATPPEREIRSPARNLPTVASQPAARSGKRKRQHSPERPAHHNAHGVIDDDDDGCPSEEWEQLEELDDENYATGHKGIVTDWLSQLPQSER
nr:hypothetical protein CFP56_24079 [Quercus suber]